jgi:ubiquinone/menaquinone biosynthesis C-methylase UbiE
MNPYIFVAQATDQGESLLSLCAGVGFELTHSTGEITAVDIHDKYLTELKNKYPHVNTVCSDVEDFIVNADDKSFDVISLIDGLEHLDKDKGLRVLKECKRVARKQILVFTQIGYLRNEPHNAWGIEGGDEYQKHQSGWQVEELKDLGYELIAQADDISQHGEPYTAVMYKCLV